MVGSEIGGGGRGRAKSTTTSDRDRQRSRSCRNLSDRCAFDPDLLRLLSDAVNPDDSESLDGTTFPLLRRPRSLTCETRREVEGETYSDVEVNCLLTESSRQLTCLRSRAAPSFVWRAALTGWLWIGRRWLIIIRMPIAATMRLDCHPTSVVESSCGASEYSVENNV